MVAAGTFVGKLVMRVIADTVVVGGMVVGVDMVAVVGNLVVDQAMVVAVDRLAAVVIVEKMVGIRGVVIAVVVALVVGQGISWVRKVYE